MTDLRLTSKQTEKLLTAMDREWQHLLMRGCDDIFYGNEKSATEAGIRERAFKAIRDAIPEDIWERWEARKRKARADELRKRAELIEAGR